MQPCFKNLHFDFTSVNIFFMSLLNYLKNNHILLLMSILPVYVLWDNSYLPWVLAVWAVSLVLSKRKFQNPFKSLDKFTISTLMLFAGIYITLGFSLLNSEDIDTGIVRVTGSLSLLVIPIVMLLYIKEIQKYNNLILRIFSLNGVFLVLFLICRSSINWLQGNPAIYHLTDNDSVFVKYFYYKNFTPFMLPNYLGPLLNVALSFFTNNILSNKLSKNKLIINILSIAIILAGIFMSGSRAGLLLMAIVAVIYFLLFMKKIKKFIWRLVIILTAISLIGGIAVNPRVYKKHFGKKEKKEWWKPTRPELWKYGIRVAMTSPIRGVGIGDYRKEVSKHFNPPHRNYLEIIFGAHNQFIDYFAAAGFMPMIFLVLLTLMGLYRAVKYRQTEFAIFIILLTTSMMFESMLFRLTGLVFYCFFYLLFLFNTNKEIERHNHL